jgi:allophanate hydrolase
VSDPANSAATSLPPPTCAGWTISEWIDAARQCADHGERQVLDLVEWVRKASSSPGPRDPAWIHLFSPEAIAAQYIALRARLRQSPPSAEHTTEAAASLAAFPLLGVPFAIKDNIDYAGSPTSAGCPSFVHTPSQTATVVQRLLNAGAILIGKTNLDQFATGLVGTRSPYGAVPNTFNPAYVSGGSSSGSASVVARGLVPFALGTDTAGSGRVPAGLNNLVGLKPTRGLLSTRGVLPACRTLDCVSIFALTIDDAQTVLDAAAGFDEEDPYSRQAPEGLIFGSTQTLWSEPDSSPDVAAEKAFFGIRIGVPATQPFFGDQKSQTAFHESLQRLRQAGAELVPFDPQPLFEVAALLYDGPWVAERHVVVGPLLNESPESVDPVVRQVIEKARGYDADDVFRGLYRLAELSRPAQALWSAFDLMVVPTAPTHYTIAQVQADPVTLNAHLGTWTNFVNLLDWSALAVPAAMRDDGLPFGITFIAPTWHEPHLLEAGRRFCAGSSLPLGATGRRLEALQAAAMKTAQPLASTPRDGWVRIAVVGAHLRGMPLNHELTQRHARFVAETCTAPCYQLYALAGTTPPKPGLLRTQAARGSEIVVELWDMPLAHFGDFVARIPPPLGIGTLELCDGTLVKGFVCEPIALQDATDITHLGGWRAYLAQRAQATG